MSNPSFVYRFVSLILTPFIRKIRVAEHVLERLKENLDKGQVIFVAQTASIIDFLVVSEILRRNKLQGLDFTHGIPGFFSLPFMEALSQSAHRMFRPIDRRAKWQIEDVKQHIETGGNGLIFLKNRWGLFNRKTFYYQGFFQSLLLEDVNAKAKYLIPTSVFLTQKRKNLSRTGWEILFGTYDIPSRSRKLWQLITHVGRGLVIFSKAVDLREEPRKFEEMAPEVIEKRIRWALLIHLNNEDRAYRGPTKRHTRQKVRLILKDRILKKELETIAERQNRSLESVRKEAEKTLGSITSDTNERVMFLLKLIFDFVWNRTLDGVDYDPKELAMIRELSTKGPLILLPSHRSHVDYLVLSHTFLANGLNPPRFAAGDNLSRWPLGPILRRAGAFFIRRSFKGEAIFPVVFEAYIRQALRDRQPITFFMEGGRSRTGKLLNPKMGMLGMILNSWSSGLVEKIPMIPITIDYGKVFEGQSYLIEKSGAEKKKEGLFTLLSTPKFLKRKHGIVRIRVSQPVYFEEELEKEGLSKETLTFRNKIPFLTNCSKKIMHQINSRVSLTAGNLIAGILLANPKRGITYDDLKTIFTLCVRFLRGKGVELAFKEKNVAMELRHAVDMFLEWGTVFSVDMGNSVIINIPVEKRNEMEFYKNNGLHFFFDLALFATSIMLLPRNQQNIENIKNLSRELYDLFESEFILGDNYLENLDFQRIAKVFLRNGGLLQGEDGMFTRGPSEIGYKTLRIASQLLLNFIESYFCVVDVLLMKDFKDDTSSSDVQKQVMNRSKLLYSVGSILLPESRNNVNFDNALEMLRAQRIVQFKNNPDQKGKSISIKSNKLDELSQLHQKLYDWMDQLH